MSLLRLSFLLVLLQPAMAAADNEGNFYFGFNAVHNRIGTEDVLLVDREPPENGFGLGLRLGLNILGYVAPEFQIDAQGQDLFKDERGGLGFVGGGLRIHPVKIAEHWVPELRNRPWDVNVYAGLAGWHLIGKQASGNRGRAYEASFTSFHLAAEYHVTPHFSVGLELPWRFPRYEPYVYFDYQDDEVFCFDQIPILQRLEEDTCSSAPSPEASFFSPMLSMTLRVPLARKPSPARRGYPAPGGRAGELREP